MQLPANIPNLRSYMGAPGAQLLAMESASLGSAASWAGERTGLGFAVSTAFSDFIAESKRSVQAHGATLSGTMASATAASQARYEAFASLVRQEMMAPAHNYQMEGQVAPVFKYDVSCTDRNIEKYMYRDDIYEICRRELYALLRAFDQQIYWKSSGGIVCFDWIETVYRWVSIAFFAVGIHPVYLFTDPNERTAEGEYMPQTRMYPPLVRNAMSGIQTQLESAGALHYKDHPGEYWFGPTFGGWLSEKGKTAWFDGSFEPDYAQRRMVGNNFGREHRETDHIQTFGTAGRTDSATREGTREYFLATFPQASDIADAQRYTKKRNVETKSTKAISARGMIRVAKAWAASVVDTLNMEFAVDSLEWYLHNHMLYFVSRGDIDMTREELRAQQNALAEQRASVKDAKVDAGFEVIDVGVDAIEEAYPAFQQIIRAAYSIVKSALKILFGWIFRRRSKPKLPQPMMLRTLADSGCATASEHTTIEDELRSIINITVEDAHEQGVATGGLPNPGPGGHSELYSGPDAATSTTIVPMLAGVAILGLIGWGLSR